MTSAFSWQMCSPLPCFILYSKPKLACYPRYLLTSYFCIPVPYCEKGHLFLVLFLEGLIGLHRNFQYQLLFHQCLGHILMIAAVAAKSLQSYLTLCNPMAAHQAPLSLGFSRQEHWSGLPFASPMHACMLSHFSHVQPVATLWTAAHQAPPSTGFSRQDYWSGLPTCDIK